MTCARLSAMTTLEVQKLLEMPLAERMALLETLWDSVSGAVDTSTDIPLWHRDELERRLVTHDSSQPGRAWDDIEKDLRARMT